MKLMPVTVTAFPVDHYENIYDGVAIYVPGDDTTLEEHLQKVHKALVVPSYRYGFQISFVERIVNMYRGLNFPSYCKLMVCMYPADMVETGHAIGTTYFSVFPSSTLDEQRAKIIEREAKSACESLFQFYKDWMERKVLPSTAEEQSE